VPPTRARSRLSRETAPARAEGGPQADLALPASGAGELKVGDVRARDEEDEGHGAEEGEEGGPGGADRHVAQRIDPGAQAIVLWVLPLEPPRQRRDPGVRLADRLSGAQAGQREHEMAVPVVPRIAGSEGHQRP
jgi:hypothetical protein